MLGNDQPVKASDMQGATLIQDNEATVFAQSVPSDKLFAWGSGREDRNTGAPAYIYASLVASGDGTGSAGDAVEGDLIATVMDSQAKDVLARYKIGDLETLADAEADNRTERPTFPAVGPAAREDRVIELRVDADAASAGVEIDPAASSARR
jgi:hypothetical protein